MKIGVFHPGTQHVWQTALALQQLERLEWFATSLFYKPDEWPFWLERYVPGKAGEKLRREFGRIAMPQLDPSLVMTAGAAEWYQRLAMRMGFHRLARHIDAIGNKAFVRHLAGAITRGEDVALWGYDGGSVHTFEYAKRLGRTIILDRTTGDLRAFNMAVAELQPQYGDWFIPTGGTVADDAITRDEQEYALADHILVGSEFAAQTVRKWSTSPGTSEKVRVLGYCFSERDFANVPAPQHRDRSRPVRFLFIGSVAPTKGIHHVLEAISQLPPGEAELTVVGHLRVSHAKFAQYQDRITYHPNVPRSEVAQIMAAHDVIVLPSYHEGAPISLYEALAAGMGIIQSDRSSLIANDKTGIILDRLDTATLVEAMRVPITDRDRLAYWRSNAQVEARKYTFAEYRDGIAAFLQDAGI